MSAAVKDNKKTEADNDEVAKKLLDIKTQSMETCPHRKTPVSQDIGTLFYDCEYAYGLEFIHNESSSWNRTKYFQILVW